MKEIGRRFNAYISFPYLVPVIKGKGYVAYQPDSTCVLVATQKPGDDIETPEALEYAFEVYKYKLVSGRSAYLGSAYKDIDFTIESSENVEINGYKMIKYFGKHTYTYHGVSREMAFVAYTVKTIMGEAYMFWMVIDETGEQSMGEVIESHADNMAKSLREEEF